MLEFNDAGESLSVRSLYDRLYCLNEIMKQLKCSLGVAEVSGQAIYDAYAKVISLFCRVAVGILGLLGVTTRVCGHHFQQTGHQAGVVANPACGQLKRQSYFYLLCDRSNSRQLLMLRGGS